MLDLQGRIGIAELAYWQGMSLRHFERDVYGAGGNRAEAVFTYREISNSFGYEGGYPKYDLD